MYATLMYVRQVSRYISMDDPAFDGKKVASSGLGVEHSSTIATRSSGTDLSVSHHAVSIVLL